MVSMKADTSVDMVSTLACNLVDTSVDNKARKTLVDSMDRSMVSSLMGSTFVHMDHTFWFVGYWLELPLDNLNSQIIWTIIFSDPNCLTSRMKLRKILIQWNFNGCWDEKKILIFDKITKAKKFYVKMNNLCCILGICAENFISSACSSHILINQVIKYEYIHSVFGQTRTELLLILHISIHVSRKSNKEDVK